MGNPSLEDSYTRLTWARERLDLLEDEIRRFRNEGLDVRPEPNPEPGKYLLAITASEPPASVIKLTSETICHLRPALDYLVYALAWLDSGQPQDGTQFPIEDTPSGFKGRRKTYLKGLSNKHVAAIEGLQPYKGGKWLATLRDLSNPDKHRKLVSLVGLVDGDFKILTLRGVRRLTFQPATFGGSAFGGAPFGGGTVVETYDQTGTQLSPDDPFAAKDVNVQLGLTLQVAFEDGSPVVETLKHLKSEIRAVIDAFQPEF